ncbi:MAG: WG repeat-containing protein [Rhodoluna sp.]
MPNESENESAIESLRIPREPYGLWLQQYEEVGMLIMDRVAVRRGDKWGFINETGQEIIPPIYAEVSNFKQRWFKDIYFEVLAEVSMERGVWREIGFINLRGDIVIPMNYKKHGWKCTSNELPKALETYLEAKSPFTLLDKSNYHLFFSHNDPPSKFVAYDDQLRWERTF